MSPPRLPLQPVREEVGWAQRAANVHLWRAQCAAGLRRRGDELHAESAAQREVAASARDGLGVRRGSQGRRRRGRSAPHLGERAGARRERAHVRRLLSLRRRPWRLARPGAGGGLFQRGSGPAGRGAPAPSRRLLPRGRDAPSACGGPGQHRGPLPSRRHLRGRSVRGGVLGRSGRSPGAPQGGHPLRRARLPALLLRRLSWSRRVLLAFGRSGGRGSGMRFLGGSGFLAVPASLRFGERAHRRRTVRVRATPRCASPAPSSWDAAASRTSAGRAPGTGWPPLASAPPSMLASGTSSASASRLAAGWPAWPRRSRALTKGNAAADGESRPLRRLSKIAAGLD